MIHENSSQAETHGMKLYSVTYSTWNGSFSELNHHNILAVGNGAEDGVRRTEFGLVRRLSTPFPEQQEQGMQMQ